MQSSPWNQNSIHVSYKKVHQKPITSIFRHDEYMFFTSSCDKTIRMWDIRLHSSIKMIRNPVLKSLSNCQTDKKSLLFVGSGKHVYSFDLRAQSVFLQQISKRTQQAHFDNISYLRVDNTDGTIGVADDEGDIRLYNYDLQCTGLLDQGHNNIVNALEFVENEKGKLCITGGFDCKLLHWKVDEEKIVREIDLQELFQKHQVKASTMPFIYSIYLHKNTLFVSTQTGHVVTFSIKDLKKPKYILEASLARINQTKVPQFNQNLMITLSRNGSFSLFDHTKRKDGVPLFLQKYKCKDEAHWMEIIRNEIIVANEQDPQLTFFTVK